MTTSEIVYTITDWYDGARTGVADFQGQPHYYECIWDDEHCNWSAKYQLTPMDAETFQLELEAWAIWLRWEAAFKTGGTTQETHPVLPEDAARFEAINQFLLAKASTRNTKAFLAVGRFQYGPGTTVSWTLSG